MTVHIAVKTVVQTRGLNGSRSARRRFIPAQREPLHLPDEKVELPLPPPSPSPPPSINLLTSILPPALMLTGTIIVALLSVQSSTGLIVMAPMFLMSLGFPIANILSVNAQKKAYQKALLQREQDYKQKLAEARKHLENLVTRQRAALEETYPSLPELRRIALTRGKLLWSRRPADDDFLALRLGLTEGNPSFTIEAPRYSDPSDGLPTLAFEIRREYQRIGHLPALLPLKTTGSVAITGRSTSLVYNVTRRLALDILIHHSPQDVHLAVLSDSRAGVEQWEWLKWVPHTDSLGSEKSLPHLAFDPYQVDRFVEFIVSEFHRRRERASNPSGGPKGFQTAFVILIDDAGSIRQRADIPLLAEWGWEAGIYLIFVNGRDWPRECRSRLECLDDRQFKFTETWAKSGNIMSGIYESATLADCDQMGRALAGLDVAGSSSRVPLPEKVRLSQVLGAESFSVEVVKQSWTANFMPKDLLHFPIGVCVQRDQLELASINLLPAEFGGNDAYHTILIGTTGSGKSEFMKSLVLGAAVAYPPSLMNFFFLDFKGGAAFSIFEDLPHVNGVVTNLRPELVERGLDSIKNEIERRQQEFAKVRVQRIWEYNDRHPDAPLPHLVLFLDEFTRGLADFPRLREVLDVLVRQGRSLGMYLVLANQDVSAEVDKLLNNVGWRIALKVAKNDELAIIDRRLANATRAGQGYLRSMNGEIIEFQAGYGGFPVQTAASAEAEGFIIYQVEAGGSYKTFFQQVGGTTPTEKKPKESALKEETAIISTLKQAMAELHIKSAARIYLEPLPETIALETILAEAGISLAYSDGKWRKQKETWPLVAFWGEVDMPQICQQDILRTDFSERDGHLWIVGAQGSGKDMALTSLLMSLALTYTPDQVHFYILELGAGELTGMEALPHTGAVIRPLNQEKERLIRLLNFLDDEMDRRAEVVAMSEDKTVFPGPALLVVINNYAELRANFPDESERLMRFVRDGKPLGIHLVVVTNRGPELIRSVSNNIARRLVLQLGSRDEYLDLLGRQPRPLSQTALGRGYWMDGEPSECQVAQPPSKLRDLMKKMREAWKGDLPRPIETLPTCIPLTEILRETQAARQGGQVLVPLGRSYETLELVLADLEETVPFWLILGPKESGKSNFLACVAKSVIEQDAEGWLVKAYAFRRSPLTALAHQEKRLQVFSAVEDIVKDCQTISEALKSGQPVAGGRGLLLLVDDLGFAFQPGKESLLSALNGLALDLESTTELYGMATGLMDELRAQLASPFLKLLRQGRTGIVFSKDTGELDWLGAQITLEQRRLDLPVGRGFFIKNGKPTLVQTPWLGECKRKK